MFYAQIGADGKVHTVCDLAGEVEDESCVRIGSQDATLIGKIYNAETGGFKPPAWADHKGGGMGWRLLTLRKWGWG